MQEFLLQFYEMYSVVKIMQLYVLFLTTVCLSTKFWISLFSQLGKLVDQLQHVVKKSSFYVHDFCFLEH